MSAGGLPEPRPDQSYAPPPPGVAPGTQAGVFRGRLVIIYGTGANTGLFIYNGNPALGNPPILAITTASTDPYGNSVQAGAITDSGMPYFLYGGTPTAGNLLVALAPAAGADSFGNTYEEGISLQGTMSVYP